MPDFSQFDDEFSPEDPFSGNKADDLTDGDYEFLVKDAKQKEARGNSIIEMKLEVLTQGKHQGQEIQHAIFMKDLDSLKRYGAILKRLGFDVDNWKPINDRPFSREYPKATRWLKGMKIKARKTTTVVPKKYEKDTEKTYHNIFIKSRADEEDEQPRVIGQEQLDAPDPKQDEDPFAVSA